MKDEPRSALGPEHLRQSHSFRPFGRAFLAADSRVELVVRGAAQVMSDLVGEGEGDAFDADFAMASKAAVKSNRAPVHANIGLSIHQACIPKYIIMYTGICEPKSIDQSLSST